MGNERIERQRRVGLWHMTDRNYFKKYKALIAKRRVSTPSKHEMQIMHYLKLLEVRYIREYNPQGLVNPATCYPLFIDFFLPDYNIAIEFDGSHHYKQIKGYSSLKKTQERDVIKTKYCLYKGIKLLRIPYWETENMELIINAFLKQNPPGIKL